MSDNHRRFWREDLAYLVQKLRSQHANAFHTVTSTQFKRAADALFERIPDLLPHQIVVEMSRLVAMIGDGHTTFHLDSNPSLGFHEYPLRFYAFSDGIFVYETDAAHQPFLGARLIHINSIPVDEVLAKIEGVVSGDNAIMRRLNACAALSIPEVLHTLNVIPDLYAGEWTLKHPSGQQTVVCPPPYKANGEWFDLSHENTSPTLWRKNPERFYWYEFLEEHQLVYMHFRAVRNMPDESIAEFCDRLFAFIDENPVERLVIDIRSNGGGDNRLNQPLVHGLIRCQKVNQPDRLFTIIGRKTFSAAMNLAVDLERNTHTLFVGEPTGASPNHYGENGSVTLPNTGITFNLSLWYWQSSTPNDKRQYIEPHIRAELSSADYRNHVDPALNAILAYR